MHCGKSKNHVLKYKNIGSNIILKSLVKLKTTAYKKKQGVSKETGRHLSDDKAREKKGRLC